MVFETLPAPLVALQDAELAASRHGRRQHHAAGAVAIQCRVVPDPYRPVAEGAVRHRDRLVVVPVHPGIDHTALQLGQREHRGRVVNKVAHQQVIELVRAVFEVAQLVNVEQVAAAALGVQDGDDLAPDFVLAREAGGQAAMADVDLDLVSLGAALVEQLAGPERICLVRGRGWRREIRLAPFLVNGHARRHLVQLLEIVRPEKFVKVEIAVVALRCAGVRAEEVQMRAVRQHDGVAGQLDAGRLARELHDVLLGGWWVHEIGLLDADGDLVAVANCPPSYKPQMPEGSARTQVIRMVLIVSSAETVQLSIDPGIVMATRQFAADAVSQKFDALAAVGGEAMVGVTERSTGDALRLADAMARMPSRFGRIDASSFPHLFAAIS